MAATDIEMTSPVRPMIAADYDQDHEYGFPAYQSQVDLCQLLQAMSLSKGKLKAPAAEVTVPYASQSANEHDASTEDLAYHSDAWESSSSKSSSSDRHLTDSLPTMSVAVLPSSLPACHFLQSILASLAPESPVLSPSPYPYPVASPFQTTNGAYLDTILLHRSLLSAFPPAHKGCAATLQEIARALETRTWRADRDSDAEAVVALRQEACLTVNWV
ncbi:hypothetical protein PAXRUDRAFT_135174 [Paxillus rubicundulus Ve08.2h10]|uniref:Unplaced genomic scaffold scaffold_90, whole genome shotgun sequence n=1 Tax=Paxillus rubicundulus Ve08.2h10 TaxID=930991 RepID=A0A0D0EBP2_9AGAM|nr:hypothetical protein PAXRUDRAFT_135174 [Paxillus rubicundulus Ve08.2h10]